MECPLYRQQHKLRLKRRQEREELKAKVIKNTIDLNERMDRTISLINKNRGKSAQIVEESHKMIKDYTEAEKKINVTCEKKLESLEQRKLELEKKRIAHSKQFGFILEDEDELAYRALLYANE